MFSAVYVIPGRAAGADPESRCMLRTYFWIPGSLASLAPRNDSDGFWRMKMATSLPLLLVPGLLCSARLYGAQIEALWPQGPVTVADHRRDDTMEAIAKRILADGPRRLAPAGI